MRTDAGKAIARGLVTHRSGASGGSDRQLIRDPEPAVEPDGSLPGFVRFFTAAPFMARLGIAARHAADGTAADRAARGSTPTPTPAGRCTAARWRR